MIEILNAIDENAVFVVSETLNGIMGKFAKPNMINMTRMIHIHHFAIEKRPPHW